MFDLRKAIRTLQNYFPALGGLKNDFYYYSRKTLRIPHEREFAVLKALPHLEGDLYLDVGGNHGQSILSMRLFRQDMRIISFEPNPRLYAEIVRRFGPDPLLEVRNYGLAQQEASLPLFTPSYRGFVYDGIATFSRENAVSYLSDKTLYFFNERYRDVSEMTCHLKRLDDLDLAPTFMKVDVEGFEYDVLMGGLETVRRHEPVIMIEKFWQDERVFTLLGELGYQEVVLENGRFRPHVTSNLNAIMMTPRRQALCP
jgi:FkbM family methyltransferase